MRTITLQFLAGILVSGSASEANAQTSAADRWYVNVSIGGSPQDQTFSESATFDVYGQKGALASAYSIGGGQLFDVSAGTRVWKGLGIGIGYSANKNKNDATVSVRVPHPLLFGQSREASATAPDLEHTEKVVHLHFVWILPLTSKFELMFMGGPSFFTVRQNLATVRAPQDVRDEAPFTSVTITNVTVTDVKDSPVGVNVGVDGAYDYETRGAWNGRRRIRALRGRLPRFPDAHRHDARESSCGRAPVGHRPARAILNLA